MLKVINMKLDEIHELIRLAADKKKLPPSMIEKDFWVCYILDYLFNRFKYRDLLEFKGGTSLSKGFGLIERFSEDIDVVLHFSAINIEEKDINEARSKTQQDHFNKELLSKSHDFLKSVFLSVMKDDINRELKHSHSFVFNENDASISFKYPQKFNDPTLLQEVKLEVGVLASWTPHKKISIKSFVAEFYPEYFNETSFEVLTTQPKRTFWEKVVILHKEANRENDKTPIRYSRHYYDVYKMIHSIVKDEAIDDLKLLKEVVEFNIKYYYVAWANFESAKPGTLNLIPKADAIKILNKDYDDMKSMIYGELPTFEEIIETLAIFQKYLNEIKS